MTADAIKSYDPKRGANLQTHVFRQLQTLQRVAPDIDEPMSVPAGLRRDRGVVGRAIQEVQDNLGREASDEEVGEIAKLPVKRVTKVRQLLHAGLPLSVIEEMGDEDEDSNDPVAHQLTPENDWHDAVYHDLGDIDRVVMQYRTGYRGYPVLPNQEIAKRLKMSPTSVSQRARHIQDRLDEFHD
jgi:DNA-directed RNA polymerase specialized sigma subunit